MGQYEILSGTNVGPCRPVIHIPPDLHSATILHKPTEFAAWRFFNENEEAASITRLFGIGAMVIPTSRKLPIL